jgi:prephenate dehydratase
MLVAQQGHEGSYHDIVRLEALPNSRMLACSDFHQVVNAVETGVAEVGLMAIENSIHGDTGAALELRSNFDGLAITEEVILDITHRLFGELGADITEFRSHPVAISQTRRTSRSRYPNARLVESTDTALAIREVAELIRNGINNVAAIGSRLAGSMYPEVVELDDNMNDYEHNFTRFVIFRKETDIDGLVAQNADKTTARLTIPDQRDSLLKTMQILSDLGIDYKSLVANTFRYDSRDGQIIVPVEFTHSWHDDRFIEAVKKLLEINVIVKNLGCYASGRVIKV